MPDSKNLTITQALQLAQQHLASGRLREAETIYRQILAANPQQPRATHGLGLVALYGGNPQAAIELLARSTQLQPQNEVAFLDLGNACLSAGQLEKAVLAYQEALALDPNFAGVYSNLGVALHELGTFDESVVCFQRAVALNPTFADAHNNLGGALKSQGRFDEAAAAIRKAIELRPDWAEAHNNLAVALKEGGLIEPAIVACRRALELKPGIVGAASNLASFLPLDPSSTPHEVFDEHRRWDQAYAQPLLPKDAHHSNDRSPDRRLRIGYVSPDFRGHSVSYFFERLLAAHSKDQVEVFCYADLHQRADATTGRLKQHASQWRNITGQSDAAVAEMIRKDQIDILIDLAGHTAGNRLLVLARKPAPIQVSYLGYPNTTGLKAIDYFLCDANTDPSGLTDAFFSEELVRLPETLAIYRPPDDAPFVGALPALSNGYVTLSSFNAISKINDRVIHCWSRILKAAPTSRMLLVACGLGEPSIAARIREAFGRNDVSADRLELSGAMPRAEYLAAHNRADIHLDTFPVNGHTITCHALWMGLPVVTLAGDSHFGRLGCSVLSNVGLNSVIAQSADEYVDIAIGMASDLAGLSALREGLRQRMNASPLTDAPAFARHVENAYRTMWRRWCAGQGGSS